MSFSVSVQQEDFDLSAECAALREGLSGEIGAICTFSGIVREFGDYTGVEAIELEHYPGMTEKVLENHLQEAQERWPLCAARIVHRIGRLQVDDQIVLVAVASEHRKASFEACEFLMDFLKTEAPFWKKEVLPEGAKWVQAKSSDLQRSAKWQHVE